jgi:hypothetical protein
MDLTGQLLNLSDPLRELLVIGSSRADPLLEYDDWCLASKHRRR